MSNTNVLLRRNSIVIDQHGIDPLLDLSYEEIGSIDRYRVYTISSDEERNLPLLSHNAYGNTQMWWVIMSYNGLISINDLRAGMEIKLPSLPDVISVLNDAQSQNKVRNLSPTFRI